MPRRSKWLAGLASIWVRAVDPLVGEAVAMRVDVELADGTAAAGVYVHKLLSQSVGCAPAAGPRAPLASGLPQGPRWVAVAPSVSSELEPAWRMWHSALFSTAECNLCGRRRGHVSRERGGAGLGAAHCAVTARRRGSVVWGQVHVCALAVLTLLGHRLCRICTAAFVRAMLAGGTQPGVWFPEQREAVPDRRALLQARALPALCPTLAGCRRGGEAVEKQQQLAHGSSCLGRDCQHAGACPCFLSSSVSKSLRALVLLVGAVKASAEWCARATIADILYEADGRPTL